MCCWANPELFDENFLLRLGGMHFLMSYVGAVGVLMVEDVMKAAFVCVTKILTGKKFPRTLESSEL